MRTAKVYSLRNILKSAIILLITILPVNALAASVSISASETGDGGVAITANGNFVTCDVCVARDWWSGMCTKRQPSSDGSVFLWVGGPSPLCSSGGSGSASCTVTFDRGQWNGSHTFRAVAIGVCDSTYSDTYYTLTIDNTPTLNLTNPIGNSVSSPFDINATATFKPTLNSTKGYITGYIKAPGAFQPSSLPIKYCTALSCTYSYKELAGSLYYLQPGEQYKIRLEASGGGASTPVEKTFDVQLCDLKVTSFTGSQTTINPSTAGSISLTGSISGSPGKPVSWKITLPGGKTVSGTGNTATAIWDGKINGRYPDLEPGQSVKYAATLDAWETEDPSCKDTKPTPITITMTKDCMLQVTFGSSANIASGALSHTQELFSTRGAGLATSITLYYNSLDSYNGSLGMGWSYNYDIAIGESSDGYVVLREGDGGRKIYTKSGGSYTSQPGDYSTLTKNMDGTYSITHKDGTRYNFDTLGRIASLTDRNGNTMSFTYSEGDLASVKDSSGRVTTLAYDPVGRITGITDPNGNAYTLGYINNMLAYVVYHNGGRWDYTYDPAGFMLTKTDPNGYTTTYTCDSRHRVTTSTDPEGKVKTVTYPQTDDTSRTKTSTVTEKDGGVWTYTYDTQNGTLTRKADPQGGVTSYTYDANRNMTSKTEPDGSVTKYSYDSSGNMTSQTDAIGQTTKYTYNSFGQVTSTTDPQGSTTTYTYDAFGNLTKTTDPTGAGTSYQYDTKGNVIQITNAAGQTATFTYDQSGNLTSVKDPTGAATSFTYDAAGNMMSQTDASGATTRFEYNTLNQLIKVTDPSGNSTTSTYDANGNRISETDANGNTTHYEHNYKGQLIKVKDALGNVTTYTYGDTGCSSCGGGTDKLTEIKDATGNSTKYEYDMLGRLKQETDALGNAISYSYDSKGNLVSKTDANGTTISFTYDGLGRLLKKAYPDNTAESFTYDSKGNILTATNSNVSYTFGYISNGKVTNVTDSNGRAVSYSYDSLGNKTKLAYPEGSVVSYSYDKANRLTSMINGGGRTYSYQYDSLGRRTKLSYPNGVQTSYAYDGAGRLTNLLTQNSKRETLNSLSYTHDKVGNRLSKAEPDVKQTYSYDAIYRLLQSTPAKIKPSGKEHEFEHRTESYTYDPVGNRQTGPDKGIRYTYDQGNQLLERTKDKRDEEETRKQYDYDRNGNLIQKLEYNDGGKIKKTTLYSYDFENRLIKVEIQKDNMQKIVTFTYDPFGRRLSKTVHKEELEDEDDEDRDKRDDEEKEWPRTTYYVYDNEDIILEYNQKGKVTAKYVHGPGIDEPLAVEKKKDIYYYHADGLGSITTLTDSKGRVVQKYEYDSFGNLKNQKNKIKQPYTFTGREWDRETGIYFYRARYYDPKTGTFISRDPLGFGGGDMNLYRYTKSNPVNWTDPSGLKTYMCKKFLHALGGSGQRTGPDIWGNPFYHQYICVITSDGKEICGGQDRSGGPWSPGTPSIDTYSPEYCTQTDPDNECLEQCLTKAILSKKRPYYGLFGPGTSCQEWASETYSTCKSK